MKAFYARVSTKQQNTERQLYDIDDSYKIYEDKDSGTIEFKKRNEAKKLLKDIEKGKINHVTVKDVDRLGRIAIDIQNTIEYFKQKNIQLYVQNSGMSLFITDDKGEKSVNPFFKMITDLMANIAEMERDKILERQRIGIKIAKENGKYAKNGRKYGTIEGNKEFLKRHKRVVEALSMKLSIRQVARMCAVSPTTVQKVKKLQDNKFVQTTLEGQIKLQEQKNKKNSHI